MSSTRSSGLRTRIVDTLPQRRSSVTPTRKKFLDTYLPTYLPTEENASPAILHEPTKFRDVLQTRIFRDKHEATLHHRAMKQRDRAFARFRDDRVFRIAAFSSRARQIWPGLIERLMKEISRFFGNNRWDAIDEISRVVILVMRYYGRDTWRIFYLKRIFRENI